MRRLSPGEIYDHDILIRHNLPLLKQWLKAIRNTLLEEYATGRELSAAIQSTSILHGIPLKMVSNYEDRGRISFQLCSYGLNKEILAFNPWAPSENIIMARTINESVGMMEGDDAVADLKASGYAEQAYVMELSRWRKQRPIAYEALALNVLTHLHPEDLARAIDEDYVPQMRDEQVVEKDHVRLHDDLANHLEDNELEIAAPISSSHPNGTLKIKARLGMIHIGPYNVEGIMFLGNQVMLPERAPESLLCSLAGKPLRQAVDMPYPFDGITIEKALNKGAGVQITTNGYEDAIKSARAYETS